MWIKTDGGDWVDTNRIEAVLVQTRDFYTHFVKARVSGEWLAISRLPTEADARAYADDFVAKYLKEDNHVD